MREEVRGKREEGRGKKREEGRGKREEEEEEEEAEQEEEEERGGGRKRRTGPSRIKQKTIHRSLGTIRDSKIYDRSRNRS